MSRVELRNISKSFGSVHALVDANIRLEKGEIHVLLGENGAGKTTLMRALYGMIVPDTGTIIVEGTVVKFKRTHDAMQAGIGMVHQHFMLVENMSVYENVIIGFEDRKGALLDKALVIEKIKKLADELHFSIEPEALISSLTVGEKQRIEILKAIYRKSEIIILDEPTAVLTPQEVDVLFGILRNLKARGHSIVMITHKLKECLAIADTISVMRDGEMVATEMENKNLTTQDLADLMVGRNVPLNIKRRSQCITDETMLEVSGLNYRKDGKSLLDNISFSVKKGEIVGIAGVEGNGQKELEEALSGNLQPDSMDLTLYGQRVAGNTKAMIEKGIALVPEDRGSAGLVTSLSIQNNIILGYHKTGDFSNKLGFVNKKACKCFAQNALDGFGIKAESSDTVVSTLSGGNQQKVVIARVLSRNPKFAIFAQPTRGVDVGAINNIHNRIFDYRDQGNGALVVSADLDEVRSLSDRIIVLFEGRIVADGKSDDFTESQLGSLMLTGKDVSGGQYET